MAPSPLKAEPNLRTAWSSAGPRHVTKDWNSQDPKPTLERHDLKAAAYSALRLLVWAKLRGTKDQGIAFADVPTNVPALKEKLGAEGLEVALLDRAWLDRTIRYRVPTPDELGL